MAYPPDRTWFGVAVGQADQPADHACNACIGEALAHRLDEAAGAGVTIWRFDALDVPGAVCAGCLDTAGGPTPDGFVAVLADLLAEGVA